MKISRVMIAAMSSGSGKTAVSCALMEALKQKGKKIAACKCGPDYIDPMFHREVLQIDSENLDLYFCSRDRLRERFAHHAEGADIAVIEGVMGYYDGMQMDSDRASAYDVAGTLASPVILVLPCRGMAMSVLAVLKGMLEFRQDSGIRGIILNRISPMSYPRMKTLIEEGLREMGHEVKVLGYLPEHEALHLQSRHLGLLLPGEIEELGEQMRRAAEVLAGTVDLDAVMKIADEAKELSVQTLPAEGTDMQTAPSDCAEKVRVGIARDPAFGFYYKDNLELLRRLGCELIPFSPMEDAGLPENLDGLLLGGGYPEVYARRLSENAQMRRSVREQIEAGLPCIAECGGFLYLLDELEGEDGISRPMAGVIHGRAEKKERLVRFGYVELYAEKDGNYLRKGEAIRGHEFHYWDSSSNGEACLAVKPDGIRKWKAVHMEGNLFAGFPHLYWYSDPSFAARFVDACRQKRGLAFWHPAW